MYVVILSLKIIRNSWGSGRILGWGMSGHMAIWPSLHLMELHYRICCTFKLDHFNPFCLLISIPISIFRMICVSKLKEFKNLIGAKLIKIKMIFSNTIISSWARLKSFDNLDRHWDPTARWHYCYCCCCCC